MKGIIIGVLIIFLVAAAVLLIRDYYVQRKLLRLATKKYKAVKTVIDKLERNDAVSSAEILELAKNPSVRNVLFRILDHYRKTELFPGEYFTREKAAESFMVNWLEFPTELGAAPERIELLSVVTLPEPLDLDYLVFKFLKASFSTDWMIGVCGPYRKDTLPYEAPEKIFSRFNVLDTTPPDLEVQWVHEHIGKAKQDN